MQVAFIGISNWALDPAKMNRGILVQRDIPDEEELIETAKWGNGAFLYWGDVFHYIEI